MGKKCCACKRFLPLSDFGKDKRTPDGLLYRCIICMREYKSIYLKAHKQEAKRYGIEYRVKHKEEKATYDIQYREENKQAINRLKAAYRERHRERLNKNHRKRYEQNREFELVRGRAYRDNNAQKELERTREYYKNNQEKEQERSREYRRNNRGKVDALSAKHRAFKLNQTPVDADFKEIQFYHAVCSETNEILGDTFFHVDHVQPLSKGGLHHEDNLQILEAELNLQKNNKWPLSDEEQDRYRGVTL